MPAIAMTASATEKTDERRTGLRALDPDLPIVAARAAMQLDSVIATARHGKAIEGARTDAIEQLSSMMSNISTAIAGESGDLASRSLVDPLTATMVSRAYKDASHKDLKSLNDLSAAADKLSEMFRKASSSENQGQDPYEALVLLRDFCVKLSEYAASKRQLAYGDRPMPTYWRLG